MTSLTEVELHHLSITHTADGVAQELVQPWVSGADHAGVEGVEVGWSRPTVRDHQAGGHLRVQAIATNPYTARRLLRTNATVKITVSVWDAQDPNPGPVSWCIGYGWVTGGHYHRHRAGWLVTIECFDIIGLCEATAMPAGEFPAQPATHRASALNSRIQDTRLDPAHFPAADVRHADVTGTSFLECAQRITPPGWRLLEGTNPGALVSISSGRNAITWGLKGSTAPVALEAPPSNATANKVTLPPAAVEDTNRVLDRSNMITTIRVEHKTLTEGEPAWDPQSWSDTTTEYHADGARPSDAVHAVTVDYDHVNILGAYDQWAGNLLRAAARALSAVEGSRLLLGALPVATTRYITEMGSRARVVLDLPAPPSDIPSGALIASQTITFTPRWDKPPVMATTVDLADSALAGVRSVSWRDFPTDTDPLLRQTRFKDMGTLTIADTVLVDAANPPLP